MRRPRSFWEARVAELAGGRSVESIAQRHGVTSARLRWWRWRLGTAPTDAPAPTRMVEIVPARAVPAAARLRMYVVGVVLELPSDTPPGVRRSCPLCGPRCMLTIAPGARVYLASQAVDLRRGRDGLCALVRGTLELDPYGGQLFVFVGRRGDRVKVLFWDHGGFVIYYKRLAKGRFRLPVIAADTVRVVLDGTEVAMLLGGFDLAQARRQSAWKREAA